MLSPRKIVQLTSWPDPMLQERLEDIGFFFDGGHRTWVRFCGEGEMQSLGEWLKRHHLRFRMAAAAGRGELKKHPRLSAALLLKGGGGPASCALCGASGMVCREWIEGDDTDSTEYPGAARFFLCGTCVQQRMQPHPRLYSPVEDQL